MQLQLMPCGVEMVVAASMNFAHRVLCIACSCHSLLCPPLQLLAPLLHCTPAHRDSE